MSKKTSYCKKALVLLIAFMMIFTMMPSMAFAESDIDNTVNSSGNSITVYASVTLGGELQKAKDDTYMAYKAVTVTDKDSDGKMTLHDMMLCLHEQYYPAYSATNIGYAMATDEEGEAAKGASSFWGKSKTDEENKLNTLFIYGNVVGNKIKSGTIHNLDTAITFNKKEVSDGVYISISDAGSKYSNSFGSYKARSYSIFLTDVSVPKNTEVAISLYNVKASGFPENLENYGIYILSEDGKNIEELTDTDGNQVLTKEQDTSCYGFIHSFSETGNYTLVTQPKDNNSTQGAAVIRVHVYEQNTPEPTELKVGIDSDISTNLIQDFDASTHSYTITIPETCDTLYGKINCDASGFASNIVGQFSINKGSSWSTKTGKLGTVLNRNSLYATSSDKLKTVVWEAWIGFGNEYFENKAAPLNKYTLMLNRLTGLKGLETDLELTEEFSSNKTEYTAFISNTADSFTLKPSTVKYNENTGIEAHTVTVNSKAVTADADNTIQVSDLEFDDNGKTELKVKISNSDTRFVDSTYTITLYKTVASDEPTFYGKLDDVAYIKGDTANKLKVLASANGNLSYQWYKNTAASTDGATAVEGATDAEFTPTADTAGVFYYYCTAKNEANGKTANSNIVSVKVYDDPTPTISWSNEIPELSVDDVAYLESKCESGSLPEYAKNAEGKYCGYYYRKNDTNAVSLTVNTVSSAGDDGLVTYRWSRLAGTGGLDNFNQTASYTPDTSEEYGSCKYSVQVTYTLLGRAYKSNVIYAYVYVDKAEVQLPDTITWRGTGTQTDPYMLENAEDLEELRLLVNDGYTFADMYLAFANDIELDIKWKGIGNGDLYTSSDKGKSLKVFSGMLDGKNHTLTYAKGSKYPLFNYVREATVENLNIKAPYIDNYGLVANYVVDYGEDGDYNIGTGGSYAPGCPDTINIKNVTIKSRSIIAESGFIGGGASGGNTVNIVGCKAEKNVKIGCDADGNSLDKAGLGSFAGSINGSVIGCTSEADIYGSGAIGGIVARKSQSMGNFKISNNAFLGSIHATKNYVGGIVGVGYSAESAPNAPCVCITNCYVAADITAADYVGGIFGGELGVIQAWENGCGNISDNYFYGTLTVTKADGSVGAVAGYMNSLNKYNCIENNYYLDTCGTSKAIGAVDIIDTTFVGSGTKPIYINTKGASKEQLAALDKQIVGKNDYTYIAKADCNRTDDPLGQDADKLAKAMSAEAFKDGTVLDLLQNSQTSLKNWVGGESYPQHSAVPVPTMLSISGNYSTIYYIGDSLDLSNAKFEVTYSDGSVKKIDSKEITVSGFDSSKRAVQTVTIAYGSVKTSIQVTVLYKDIDVKEIYVYFTLLGDDYHGEVTETTGTHTLKDNNLKIWIGRKKVKLDNNTTVYDVFKTVLNGANISWDGSADNQYGTMYISGVENPNTKANLCEFDNGPYSGWMYTLNGTHSLLGVDQQFLNNGDVIVFHYTDDYTKEEGSDKWGVPGAVEEVKEVTTDKTASTTTSPTDVKVSEKTNADGTKESVATVTVSADNQKEILKQAKANKSKEIILQVSKDSVKDATKADVQLDKSFIESVLKDTDAKLTVKTPFGDKTYTQDELKALAAAAAGKTVSLEIVKSEKTDEELKAEQLEAAKATVAKASMKARSTKTAKGNVKIVFKPDTKTQNFINEMKDMGYTVKYRFYRSTKKSSGYKTMLTKTGKTYTNTSGKKGTKYYYKVQVRVYDENGKCVAKTALKQCKYASRTWTK